MGVRGCDNSRVSQTTLVVELGKREQDLLEERLKGGDFEYRSVDHARFSARGEGVVATLYRSGKLVVQGRDPRVFAARYVEGYVQDDAPSAPKDSSAPWSAATKPARAITSAPWSLRRFASRPVKVRSSRPAG